MTTPNTTGPSGEIQRYAPRDCWGTYCGAPGGMDRDDIGSYVLHSDHLAALSRARDEARREALEEVRSALEAARQMHGGVFALDVMAAIAPTPQGETKEQQP